MMPLWTTTRSPVQSLWGWAFSSVGRPWVAQRVWPSPTSPEKSRPHSTFSSSLIFPTLRWTTIRSCWRIARPAESYPRYSRRLSPSKRTGTTFLCPTYPTIPHIALPLPFFRPKCCSEAGLIDLLGSAKRQRIGRHILCDGRSGGNDGASAHRDRRHEARIAAYKHIVFDHGLMFGKTLIVAGDRPGANIDTLSDAGVADVAQMWDLGPFTDDRLLDLHEVSDLDSLPKRSLRPQVCVGPDLAPVTDLTLLDNAPIQDYGIVADRRITDSAA